MKFQEKLNRIINKNKSIICVGLDSDLDNLPGKFKKSDFPQFNFNKYIIDFTCDLVCAYKPNSAFYEAQGAKGITELMLTCDYLIRNHPEIPIILDAKRGDIGSTNKGYLKYAFEYLKTDAITLHPYLGRGSLAPFFKLKDKGFFILCRTSNPGAGEIQDLKVNNQSLYKHIAQIVKNDWNKFGNCMLVAGATYPNELAEIRRIAGEMTLLIPGIGAQGGEVETTLKAGLNSKKSGLIISLSRDIIFSNNPRKSVKKLNSQMREFTG